MKIRRYFSVLILCASAASVLADNGQSTGGNTSPETDPTQLVHSLPNQLVGPLPGQVVGPLSGEIVRSLPGQMTQPLPGQMTGSLSGQVVRSLPGEMVRSIPYRASHPTFGPLTLHVQAPPPSSTHSGMK
jgi:hypothetical protein